VISLTSALAGGGIRPPHAIDTGGAEVPSIVPFRPTARDLLCAGCVPRSDYSALGLEYVTPFDDRENDH